MGNEGGKLNEWVGDEGFYELRIRWMVVCNDNGPKIVSPHHSEYGYLLL